MAIFLFTKAITEGRPIKLSNHGRMRRDFTHIDDACRIVLRLIDHVPAAGPAATAPARIYNIGNQHPEELVEVVALLEKQLGRPAARYRREARDFDRGRHRRICRVVSRPLQGLRRRKV